MKIERFLRLGLFIAVIAIIPAIFLAACGSDSNSPGENPNPTITADINGLWFVRSTVNASNCGEGTYLDAWAAEVSQLGNSFVLEDSVGGEFSGTVSGNTVSLSGSYDDGGGTTTINSMTLTVSGNTMSGNSSWTWSDGSGSCSGSSQNTATRGTARMEIEPNNDDGQAQVISFSNNSAFLEGAVNRDSDQYDVYSLALSSSATIEVELSHFDTASHDLDLCIYDDNGNYIGCSDSYDNYERVEAAIFGGIRYLVYVRAYSSTGTAPYCVSIDLN